MSKDSKPDGSWFGARSIWDPASSVRWGYDALRKNLGGHRLLNPSARPSPLYSSYSELSDHKEDPQRPNILSKASSSASATVRQYPHLPTLRLLCHTAEAAQARAAAAVARAKELMDCPGCRVEIRDHYADPSTGLYYVYLEQYYKGLPLLNGRATVVLDHPPSPTTSLSYCPAPRILHVTNHLAHGDRLVKFERQMAPFRPVPKDPFVPLATLGPQADPQWNADRANWHLQEPESVSLVHETMEHEKVWDESNCRKALIGMLHSINALVHVTQIASWDFTYVPFDATEYSRESTSPLAPRPVEPSPRHSSTPVSDRPPLPADGQLLTPPTSPVPTTAPPLPDRGDRPPLGSSMSLGPSFSRFKCVAKGEDGIPGGQSTLYPVYYKYHDRINPAWLVDVSTPMGKVRGTILTHNHFHYRVIDISNAVREEDHWTTPGTGPSPTPSRSSSILGLSSWLFGRNSNKDQDVSVPFYRPRFRPGTLYAHWDSARRRHFEQATSTQDEWISARYLGDDGLQYARGSQSETPLSADTQAPCTEDRWAALAEQGTTGTPTCPPTLDHATRAAFVMAGFLRDWFAAQGFSAAHGNFGPGGHCSDGRREVVTAAGRTCPQLNDGTASTTTVAHGEGPLADPLQIVVTKGYQHDEVDYVRLGDTYATKRGESPIITLEAHLEALEAEDVGANPTAAADREPTFGYHINRGVVAHEFTHAVTYRLIGGPSRGDCMVHHDGRALFEAWSDFIPLILDLTEEQLHTPNLAIELPWRGHPSHQGYWRRFYLNRTHRRSSSSATTPRASEDDGAGDAYPDELGAKVGDMVSWWTQLMLDLYVEFVKEYGFDADWFTPIALGDPRATTVRTESQTPMLPVETDPSEPLPSRRAQESGTTAAASTDSTYGLVTPVATSDSDDPDQDAMAAITSNSDGRVQREAKKRYRLTRPSNPYTTSDDDDDDGADLPGISTQFPRVERLARRHLDNRSGQPRGPPGNRALVRLWLAALQLLPCQPTLPEARDALRDADRLLFGGFYAHHLDRFLYTRLPQLRETWQKQQERRIRKHQLFGVRHFLENHPVTASLYTMLAHTTHRLKWRAVELMWSLARRLVSSPPAEPDVLQAAKMMAARHRGPGESGWAYQDEGKVQDENPWVTQVVYGNRATAGDQNDADGGEGRRASLAGPPADPNPTGSQTKRGDAKYWVKEFTRLNDILKGGQAMNAFDIEIDPDVFGTTGGESPGREAADHRGTVEDLGHDGDDDASDQESSGQADHHRPAPPGRKKVRPVGTAREEELAAIVRAATGSTTGEINSNPMALPRGGSKSWMKMLESAVQRLITGRNL
ncbi:hypothetical protein IWQ60_000683 [Tieghemiomyces parasiticus]|uniref:FTP domain-containing protein n=1 Tax=Tieghemiomyces parasiticus TaxID=78921 RepID=A0A9W8E2M1_9FUNG|nr:hypothetical protein IWQ60_000683 [Tieghemiomyces parasiticus]